MPPSLFSSRCLAALGAALVFDAVAWANAAATLNEASRWATGLDLTFEGAARLNNGPQGHDSFHSLALASVEWSQAELPARSVQLQGYASAMTLSGRGPTEAFLGDALGVSNTEGFASTRLYSWWLGANRGDWSVRAGALLADEEFAGTEAGGHLLNSAFGWPAFISANTINAGPAFFVAAPGLRLERTWGETGAWRVGIYDGDAFDSPTGDPAITRHGLHYQLGGAQGWFAINEAAYAPQGGTTRFKAGVWLHTAAFADLSDPTQEHSSNYGAYGAIEQTLAGKTGEPGHVEFFVRGGTSPSDRNAIGWAIDTGVSWTGPISGRPADLVTLGVVHAHFSGPFAEAARLADPASPAPDFEQVVEANYTLILSDRFSLQPDLQYLRHPGGSATQGDALVFLLRLNASF